MDRNKKLKIGFYTFEQYHRKKDIGSTRIRANNLIKYWSEGPDIGSAEIYKYGQKYDVLIFQKVYFPKFAESFDGIKILDLCDPDWLVWNYKIKEMIEVVDAITCSTFSIAQFIVNMTDKPVIVIPDRVDLDVITKKKEHIGEAKKVVWFGYCQNHESLATAIHAIKKRGLELIVISDRSYVPTGQEKGIELTNYPWSPSTWMDDILRADMVINPRYNKGRFKFKSDNKTTQSWALGMPVAFIDTDLDKFASENARKEETDKRLKEVAENFDVRKSVVELKDVIIDLIK